jgi:hypothetical protein
MSKEAHTKLQKAHVWALTQIMNMLAKNTGMAVMAPKTLTNLPNFHTPSKTSVESEDHPTQ